MRVMRVSEWNQTQAKLMIHSLCTLASPLIAHSTSENICRRSQQKVKTRNNLLQKLASTTWGSTANILCISALALSYSLAAYCAPVWNRSAHTDKVDSQLNSTMQIIAGTVKST